TDVRSRDPDCQGRTQDLGKHRDGLLALQQPEERSDAGRSRHAARQEAHQAALESGHHDYHRDQKYARKLARLFVLEYGVGRRLPRTLIGMLKKSSRCVLTSFRYSTYTKKYASCPHSLRPCGRTF